jgi:choline-phosphate cytidylyltransferase
MIRVITYGTYDLLHRGHIRLLERAKALGDYLIVGVTADGFDRARGKINVQQSLMERIEAVKATGLADEIIVEEYEGQKIDDIRRLGVDIFTVGSDWMGHFDYLGEYCKVVYLERTQGISSSELRSEERNIRLGLVGESNIINKFERESHFVNGLTISGVCTSDNSLLNDKVKSLPLITAEQDELLSASDALYIVSSPVSHYNYIRRALERGVHVLCESPVVLDVNQWKDLCDLASQKRCILMESVKTAYSMAYYRMLLLAKTGIIGKIISVDAICTSMRDYTEEARVSGWNSICAWGPTALLPIFQLLGTDYVKKDIVTHKLERDEDYDLFTKVALVFKDAVASIKVGQGVKSEGELIISGTKGYIYVPAPWWKTDYFEVRYENPADNKRYFYQLEGEGIRYELVIFLNSIKDRRNYTYIDKHISKATISLMQDFFNRKDLIQI